MTSWHFFFIARLLESVVVYTTIIFSLKVFFRTGKPDFFPLYMLRSIVCKGYLGFTAEFCPFCLVLNFYDCLIISEACHYRLQVEVSSFKTNIPEKGTSQGRSVTLC